jgi:hypothetical protein
LNPELALALRSQRVGVLLSLLACLSGFALGGVFGAWEDGLKEGLAESGAEVLEQRYGGDEAALDQVTAKAWTYYKRAHMHWGAIGAATLAISLLLAATLGGAPVARWTSLALGLGAVGYPCFWLLAGRRAPALGGTGAAKDTLQWLAVPSAGLLLIGTAAALVLVAARLFGSREA